MNSALKPILAQAGVPQPSGQASPAKGNVAGVNHAGHPQGAQGSLLVPAPQAAPPAAAPAPAAAAPAPAPAAAPAPLVGQNLVQPGGGAAPPAPHAAPHMAPVSADMAQMAQNMSHHGNLSHVSQNSVTPANIAASPSKSASSSAPLSLVADKPASAPVPAPGPPAPSQPLALTRTPDKKEPESMSQANGTVESAKPVANTPSPVKPLSNDISKEKEPSKNLSPAKPAEKAANPPSTPQKTEAANAVGQADGPAQAKVVTASEPPEKSPAKPVEPKPAPIADVAPAQNDSKPDNNKADKSPEKAAVPPAPKPEATSTDKVKAESPVKPEPKKVENKPEKAAAAAAEVKKDDVKPADTTDGPKKEAKVEAEKPVEQKSETKKPEPTPKATKAEAKAKSTLKLATVNTPIRKRRQASPTKAAEGPSSAKKAAESEGTPDSRTKRNRTQVQLYQSPTPELAIATKLSAVASRATPPKQNDDKLIVFYKNEYLAVRNAEGGFYVCQALQNVYRSTRKIKIRWLSQDKADSKGETYKPDFYDVTDMECVLTTLSLSKAPAGGGAQLLKPAEEARAKSILQRALAADTGDTPRELTEEHPDGLDLSLYKDESQLDKKSKRKATKTSPRKSDAGESPATPAASASKRPSRSPRKPSPAPKPAGSKPPGAASKTAVTPKPSKTPAKRTAKQAKLTPAKSEPPAKTPAKGRRATRESKPSPIVPTPSTSTGKATRTPRKPPAHK